MSDARLDRLLSCEDAAERNALAIALSDAQVPGTFEALVALLTDARTAGARGTLLYALEPYDCAPIFALLVELVLTDGFEASHQALVLIDATPVVDAVVLAAAIDRAHQALRTADAQRRPIIEQLIEELGG